MLTAIKNFWANHVQKTLGWLIAGLAGIDFLNLLGVVGTDLRTLISPTKYTLIHLIAGTLVAVRAHLAKPPVILPPPTVPPITQ